jgi:hypothetical protein
VARSHDQSHCCLIVQATYPYHYDLVEILALPSGLTYHNRYDERWIDPNLRHDIATAVDRRLIIIMRDQEWTRLVPVRWATVTWAQAIGGVFFLEYVLDDLVSYRPGKGERNSDILHYSDALKRCHPGLSGTAAADLTPPAVFLSAAGRDFPTASATDLSQWGNVVGAVATAAIYEKVNFLKIVDLQAGDGTAAKISGQYFRVLPNTVYKLRLFQTMPNFGDGKQEAQVIRLTAFPDHVALLRPEQRAVGKYDMLTFALKVLDLRPKEHVLIEVEYLSAQYRDFYVTRSLHLPLVVVPEDHLKVILWAVLTLIALVFIFKPAVVGGDSEIIRNIAIVAFVLLIAGSTRPLQAFWPRLPWRRPW